MRYLRTAEVAMLVAGLVIGHGNANADENFDLPTVTVSASRYPQNDFYFVVQDPTSATPIYSGGNTQPITDAIAHQMDCATQYAGTGTAGTPASHAGPRPGWTTYYVGEYGWFSSPASYAATDTSTPPASGGPWAIMAGVTVGASGAGASYFSTIFGGSAELAAGNFTANVVESFAHEWAHQWGATDDATDPNYNAFDIGQAARKAYQADNGSKCGGL